MAGSQYKETKDKVIDNNVKVKKEILELLKAVIDDSGRQESFGAAAFGQELAIVK